MQPKVDLAAPRPDLHRVGLHDDALSRASSAGERPSSPADPALPPAIRRKQIGFGDVALHENADVASVAQHGHAIGDTRHLGDAVGDDQDAGARVAQLADLGEQAFGRIEVERGGGFVEDEDLRLRRAARAPIVIHALRLSGSAPAGISRSRSRPVSSVISVSRRLTFGRSRQRRATKGGRPRDRDCRARELSSATSTS